MSRPVRPRRLRRPERPSRGCRRRTGLPLHRRGAALTLTGTSPSDEVKAAVEAAAKAGWPNLQIINNIALKGAAPSCDNLQATVDANLAAPIKFETGSDKLTVDGEQQLSAVVSAVEGCPEVKLTVIGHTDNTGTDAINNPLSENRAKSVAAYLVSQGIPADAVTSKGAGSTEPVASNDTAAGRARTAAPDHSELGRNEMSFVAQWLWYLLAFLVGSAVAW